MEEALKMRNLLQEFLTEHGVRRPSILGVREHIFTGRLIRVAQSSFHIRLFLCSVAQLSFQVLLVIHSCTFLFNYAVSLLSHGLCPIRSIVL